MRIARDLGDVSVLLPEGCSNLADAPWTLHDGITQALGYLSWEELPEDERPPHRIWDDPKGLKEHFDRVKRNREREFGDRSGTGSIEDPVENAAARDLLVGG